MLNRFYSTNFVLPVVAIVAFMGVILLGILYGG